MKTRLRKLICLSVAAIAVAILARTYWICSHVDGGWRILRNHLLAGLPPIFSRPELPDDKIWFRAKLRLLDEANRIEADPNSTAEDCMGSAWLLASYCLRIAPDPQIIGRIVWQSPPKNPTEDDWHQLDATLLKRAQQLAALATKLDSENIDWWRHRALLLNSARPYVDVFATEFDPENLADAEQHDPDNALYDYLRAIILLNRSFSKQETEQGPIQVLSDRTMFETAQRVYERAAEKRVLLCGEGSYDCAAHLFSKLAGPLELKLSWNNIAGFEVATEQFIDAIETPLQKANSHDLPLVEVAQFQAWIRGHDRWRQQIVMSPATLWLKDRLPPPPAGMTSAQVSVLHRLQLTRDEEAADWNEMLYSIGGVAACAMSVIFLILAAVSWLAAKLLKSPTPLSTGVGLMIAPLVFLIPLLITFLFVGMVAAYRPEFRYYPQQIGIGLCVMAVLALAPLALISVFVYLQTRLPLKQRSKWLPAGKLVLIVFWSFGFLVALFSLIDPKFRGVAHDTLNKFPSNLLAEKGVDYVARESLGISVSTLGDAGLEWCARGCAFWTVAITFICLLCLGWPRATVGRPTGEKSCASLQSAMKSAIALALLLILASCAASSQAVHNIGLGYERDRARLGDYAWFVKMAEERERELELAPQLQ